MAKRLFDLVVSASALLLLAPLLALLALWIKLDSAGPVLY
ncbi:MAG: sugar transferase, partial [Burkholderiales bacterium]|nr:sugar transferase [Burkholderiales bacterium]